MTGLEALEKELNLLQQQKSNLLHKQAHSKTDNEAKYWQFRIDKFNEKISNFETYKKSLNALEIIKEKCVNVYWFKSELTLKNISYRYYVNNFGSFHNGLVVKLLDEEEFDLLKEVLE